jgi:hypothetical protein
VKTTPSGDQNHNRFPNFINPVAGKSLKIGINKGFSQNILLIVPSLHILRRF